LGLLIKYEPCKPVKMRVITLDELNSNEVENCREYLSKLTTPGPIEDLYWYYLPEDLLTDTQKSLNKEKGPYKISIEIGNTFVKFELLVRADMIHNEGAESVNIEQLVHLYKFIDKMTKELKLITCS
jgi:hypothetical protein